MTALARVRTPAQPRAVRTRQALLDAAARDFAARGWAGATAKTIAARAKVATGSFYQYFTGKDALLRELAASRLATVVERAFAVLESDPPAGSARALATVARERLCAVVGIVVDLHREDPALHAVLTERRHADPELEQLWGSVEHALVERLGALLARWGQHADPLARAFVLFNMLEGAVHSHVLGRAVVSDDRFIAALVDALMAVAQPIVVTPPS